MIRTVFDPSDARRATMHLHDVLGEIVLRAVEEPAFENVSGLCAPMRETRTVIGLKHYPFGMGVDWDGTIARNAVAFDQADFLKELGPRDVIFFKVGRPAVKIRDLGWEATRRSLEDGLPIVTTHVDCRGVDYAQTVFAYAEEMSSDRDMEVVMRWTIANRSSRAQAFRLEVCANPAAEENLKTIGGVLLPGRQKALHLRILYRNIHERRELTKLPGYPYTGKLFGPWNIRPELQVITQNAYDMRHEACRSFWKKLLSEGLQITTPERRVNEAFKAWQVYNFFNTRSIKFHGKIIDTPHDGTGFYGAIYGITALTLVHGWILTGRLADARHVLESLFPFQEKDGLFLQRYGLCDNGFFLYAIGQYVRYSGDLAWFKRVWPRARRAIQWMRSHRNLRQADRGKVEYGLLKGQYTADKQVSDYCYLSDAYNWLGLAEISRTLELAGRTAEAGKLRQEAESYRRDILASMRKASFPERKLFPPGAEAPVNAYGWHHRAACWQGSLNVVPMTPVSRALEKEFIGSHYYAIVANEVLETELLDVKDPLYRDIVALMEQRGAFLLGMLSWCEHTGIDHAYTYGYWLNKLREGDLGKVLLGFYGMLAYGMDRDTYAGTEITDLLTGKPHYGGKFHYQPHTLSNSQQIRLLRMMLVKEEGRDLYLAFGAPRPWMKDLRVRNAVTPWGKVSYRIQVEGDRAHASVEFAPLGRQRPQSIRLKIRDPLKRRWQEVTASDQVKIKADAERETIILPARPGTVNLVFRYASGSDLS